VVNPVNDEFAVACCGYQYRDCDYPAAVQYGHFFYIHPDLAHIYCPMPVTAISVFASGIDHIRHSYTA
jgi:hypothetical protein